MCVEYFQFIGLDISVDGRDKSVYTNNLTSPSVSEQTLKVTTVHKNKTTTKTLPFYKSKESYKYLGIWINLGLNWSDQTRISNAMYSKYLSYLYKKCFNASQTAEILNLVVFPSLTYRMNIIKFPAPTIKKWDKQARNLLAYKLRENQFIDSLHWYLPNNKYGYNLFKLTDLQTICLPANYLNYSANFIDVYARRSTLAIFDQSLITEQSATLLSRYKYEVARNYEYKLQPDGEIGKYFDNKTLLTNLMAGGVNDITTIMDDDKLKTLEEITDIIGDWTKRKQKYLQNNMCV
jgi:hypothetical protein